MRQFKTIILFLSVLVLSAACQKDKYELNIPEAGVRLGFPVEGATLNLNDESVTSFTFSWDKVCEGGNSLVFSSSPYLLGDTVLIHAGEANEYVMSVLDADVHFSALGVGGGKTGTIYWTVKPTDKLSVAATEIHSFTVQRIQTQLITPADQATAILNADTPEETILFSWQVEGENIDTEYQLCFGMDSGMKSDIVKVDAGNTGECSLTQQQLQDLITQLPISLFGQNTIYWNAVRKSDGTFISRTSHVLKFTGMLIFTDIRGDEKITYRVAKVKYSTGEEVVWLAENLRTTKYPDGTDISLANGDYWNAPSDISEGLQKAYGKYYSIKIVDKIVSDGWKMPTFEDYKLLLNESLQTGSADVLKHRTYWNWSESVPDNANAWGIGLVPGGYVQYVGANEKVINYNQADNNCYLLTRDLAEQVVLFSDYDMRTKEIYNVNAWGGAPARFIYIGK